MKLNHLVANQHINVLIPLLRMWGDLLIQQQVFLSLRSYPNDILHTRHGSKNYPRSVVVHRVISAGPFSLYSKKIAEKNINFGKSACTIIKYDGLPWEVGHQGTIGQPCVSSVYVGTV